MFDGSHRSRRTIDLSGRRRQRRKTATATSGTDSIATASTTTTSTAQNKSQLLEEARIQREGRRQVQRRHAAAKSIQRIHRGNLCRRRVAKNLQRSSACKDVDVIVSMRLSKPLLPYLEEGIPQVLLKYSRDAVPRQEQGTLSFSQCRILKAALRELRPTSPSSSGLLPLVTRMLQSSTGGIGMDCFLPLITCCQEWLWRSQAHVETARTLWLWTCRMASISNQDTSVSVPAMSLLACTVFCCKRGLFGEWDKSVLQKGMVEAGLANNVSSALSFVHTVLLPSLVTVFTSTMESDQTAVQETVRKSVQGRECTLLLNALDLWKLHDKRGNSSQWTTNASLCSLVDFCLSKRRDLAFLASLVARGENVAGLVLNKRNGSGSNAAAVASLGETLEETDEDEEEDVEMEDQATASAAAKKPQRKSHVSGNLTRRDLQTVPKLDRLYQESVTSKLKRLVLSGVETSVDKEPLVELAIELGNPTIWLSWGNAIFGKKDAPSLSNDEQAEAVRKTYVKMLFSLLQSTTGLRPSRQSPFMSQLAFHRGLRILEGLWQSLAGWMKETQAEENELLVTAGMTVFCDLFAHHLLVLHDEEFLRYYTASDVHGSIHATTATNHKRVILAEDVIACLGRVLYAVYWTKPVVAADVSGLEETTSDVTESLKRNRGRLLLSGTKLWNSLYERWCRLVRHAPFCDESAWWFPSLMSRDADGVVSRRHNNDHHDDGGVMSMDIDESDDEEDHHEGPTAAEQQSDALAEIFRDPKMARILTCIPQALPFERRVKMFSSLLLVDKQTTQDEEAEFRRVMMMMMARGEENTNADFGGRERVEIRRGALYDDSMNQLNQLGSKLKRKVQVTFINQHGAQEAGIDGGGVFKEFLDDLIKEAFDPRENDGDASVDEQESGGAPQLFSVTPMQTLVVNASATFDLSHYEFLGRVLGKAVYESILVEPQFCLPFLNQLLGKQNTLDDLKNFDAEYYNNLIKLRNLDAKDIDGLGLTFELTQTTTSRSGPGVNKKETRTTTRELIPGGGSIAVTKQNVIQYVHLVAHQRLNVDGAAKTKAFLKGFRDLIPASWLRLFSSNELQKLISGDDTVRGIDVSGMKAVMRYSGGYHASQPIIQWFWEVVEEMAPEQQRKFLRFMTSCSRQPLLGFKALEPPPCIQQLRLDDGLFAMLDNDVESLSKRTPLPTSGTCMNLLKLPNYRNKMLLKKKLLDAIESGAGFELT